jgi:hypothetical protein
MRHFEKTGPLISSNQFSSTTHSYSRESKEFTEHFISVWSNFVKYDDPNYGKNIDREDFWKKFTHFQINLEDSEKTNGNYISFKNERIHMKIDDFSSHKCSFWKNAGSSPLEIKEEL